MTTDTTITPELLDQLLLTMRSLKTSQVRTGFSSS
jgi:hypothetical protein